jgi:hypothetical protein
MHVRFLAPKNPMHGLVVLFVALAPIIAIAQTASGPVPAVSPDRTGAVLSVPPPAPNPVGPASPNASDDLHGVPKRTAAEPVEPAGQVSSDKKSDVVRQPNGADFDELGENIRNTMELVFKNKREIDAIQQRGPGAQLTDLIRKTQELEKRISALEQRFPAKFGTDAQPLPQPSDAKGEPVSSAPAPPAPTADANQPWRIEVDASGRPRLISKMEAENWPRAMASSDQCAKVGAWIEEQSTRLVKDGFFVRQNARIALCRRNQKGDWRVYSGNAGTDRFHIVVSSGG